MKKDFDNINLCASLYTLTLLYKKVIEILDAFSTTLFTLKDPLLNKTYLSLVSKIDNIEQTPSFKKIGMQTPPLFESLVGDVENMDIDWEYNKKYVDEYLGKIDAYCLTNCKQENFKLDAKIKTLLSNVNKTLDNFKKKYLLKTIQLPKEVIKANGKSQTSKDKIYQWGELKLNVSQGTIQYGDNPIVEVSNETEGIKFLIFLFENPRVVEYIEIAKYLELNSYHANCTNQDMARDVQFVKRDSLAFLKTEVGIPQKEAKNMIITKRNFGLKLHQQV